MPRLVEEIRSAAVASMVAQENALISEALQLHTKTVKPNPYDYLNRMSRLDLADGYIVFLDQVEIIWISKPTFQFEGATTELKIQYRFIGPQV